MIDVLSAEWVKIRTVRSTYVVLGVVAVFVGLTALLAWYAATTWDGLSARRRADFALAAEPPLTEWVAGLCLAVLGVITITSEYASGMIRTTFTAVPRRTTVLAAKAVVVAVVAFVVGQAAVFGTYHACRLIIGDRPIRGQEPMGVPLLLALGASVAMYALLGLGLAAVMRSAVAAIATVAALWYVLPIVVHHLPAPWDDRVGSLMPDALAGQLAGTGNEDSVYGAVLPPPVAAAVMVAYAVVPLGVAAVLIRRRDV